MQSSVASEPGIGGAISGCGQVALSEGIRGELLDALIEVVLHARGPAARATVISELVQEMCAVVQWLHDSGLVADDPRADELASITRLSRAAQDHQRQMSRVTSAV